jgi:hypothetical protein
MKNQMDCFFFIMQDRDDGARLNFHAISIAGIWIIFHFVNNFHFSNIVSFFLLVAIMKG